MCSPEVDHLPTTLGQLLISILTVKPLYFEFEAQQQQPKIHGYSHAKLSQVFSGVNRFFLF